MELEVVMKHQHNSKQAKLYRATSADYPILQNMARFYVYDLSRSCGFISQDWACPCNGLYESFDFKTYFTEPAHMAFMIKVDQELAGFVLLNKQGILSSTEWNIGEFFILAKFQNKGIGQSIAQELWTTYPGVWEISVIPENKPALAFWRKAVLDFTAGNYTDTLEEVTYDQHQNQRHVLSFNTSAHHQEAPFETEYSIRCVSELNTELAYALHRGCTRYEASVGIDKNYQECAFILYNNKANACGILKAHTVFAEVHIDELWIDSPYRRQGYGRALLEALEKKFSGKGFNNINCALSAFQSPDFYKKCGYSIEYIRKDEINPLLSKIFFVKLL